MPTPPDRTAYLRHLSPGAVAAGTIAFCDPAYWRRNGLLAIAIRPEGRDGIEAAIACAASQLPAWVRLRRRSVDEIEALRPENTSRSPFVSADDEIRFVEALVMGAKNIPCDLRVVAEAAHRVAGYPLSRDWARKLLKRHGFHRTYAMSPAERAYETARKQRRSKKGGAVDPEVVLAYLRDHCGADAGTGEGEDHDPYEGHDSLGLLRQAYRPWLDGLTPAGAQPAEDPAGTPEAFRMTAERRLLSERRWMQSHLDWRWRTGLACFEAGCGLPRVAEEDAVTTQFMGWLRCVDEVSPYYAAQKFPLISYAVEHALIPDPPAILKAALWAGYHHREGPELIAAALGEPWSPELVCLVRDMAYDIPEAHWPASMAAIGGTAPRDLSDGPGGYDTAVLRLALLSPGLESFLRLVRGVGTADDWQGLLEELEAAMWVTEIGQALCRADYTSDVQEEGYARRQQRRQAAEAREDTAHTAPPATSAPLPDEPEPVSGPAGQSAESITVAGSSLAR